MRHSCEKGHDYAQGYAIGTKDSRGEGVMSVLTHTLRNVEERIEGGDDDEGVRVCV